MKSIAKITAIAAMFAFGAATASAQTIRIANNNVNAPTGANVFSTIQAAHDASEVGDIIHVIGSPTRYAGATIRKRLTIIGIGTAPDKDVAHQSWVNGMTLTTGTGTNANGTVIEGLLFDTTVHLDGATSDIRISRCFFSNAVVNEDNVGKSNIVIEDNIWQRFSSWSIDLNYGGNSNIVIRNNIFLRSYLHADDALIANNVFVALNEQYSIRDSNNLLVVNNIFYRMQPMTGVNINNSVFNNNLAITISPDTDNLPTPDAPIGTNTGQGNIEGQDPLFVNFPEGATLGSDSWTATMDFNLQAGSPGKNAGSDGTDLGIYGGTEPYSRLVPLPIIQSVNTAAAIKQGETLSTTVQAQAQ